MNTLGLDCGIAALWLRGLLPFLLRLGRPVFVVFLVANRIWAVENPSPADLEPPIFGRPAFAPFSNAIGNFLPQTKANPTKLRAEDPLIFTLRVTAEGLVVHPPERPDLREIPAFVEPFFIEDRTDQDSVEGQTWEFVYQLKPKNTTVQAIPSFPLVYYQPGILPAERGYMTRWAPAIPLAVRSRDETQTDEMIDPIPVDVPSTVLDFVTDQPMLSRQESEFQPGLWTLGLFLVAPPIVCVGWYMAWRHLYPDAARLARMRRSAAAQQALKKLRSLARAPLTEQADGVPAVMAEYLHHRLDLQAAEPTPNEVAAHLRQAELPAVLIDQAAQFFRDCDAFRFRPDPPRSVALSEAAVALILGLEAETWAG